MGATVVFHPINLCALIVGSFLLTGAAGQAIVYYLCAVVVPAAWFFRGRISPVATDNLLRAGLWLTLLFWVLPLVSFFRQVVPVGTYVSNLAPADILRGNISSSIYYTAVGWFIAYLLGTRGTQRRYVVATSTLKPMELFTIGLTIFSVGLFIYSLVQHLTGFDYRATGFTLPDTERFKTGGFRVSGLFGHPLSLASVSLAIVTFYGAMIRDQLAELKISTVKSLFLKFRWQMTLMVVHLGLIALSGGRAAFAICAVFLFLFGVTLPGRPKVRLATLGAFLGLIFIAMLSPIGARFSEVNLSEAIELNRYRFLQVHWQIFLDAPWFGQGAAVLRSGLRTLYYRDLGFGTHLSSFNAHNLYVEFLAAVGVIGCGFIVIILAKIRARFAILWARVKSESFGFRWAVAANLVHGLTQNTFLDSHVVLFYLALAMMITWHGLIKMADAGMKKRSMSLSGG